MDSGLPQLAPQCGAWWPRRWQKTGWPWLEMHAPCMWNNAYSPRDRGSLAFDQDTASGCQVYFPSRSVIYGHVDGGIGLGSAQR